MLKQTLKQRWKTLTAKKWFTPVAMVVVFTIIAILLPNGHTLDRLTPRIPATTQQDNKFDAAETLALIMMANKLSETNQALFLASVPIYNDKCAPLDETMLAYAAATKKNVPAVDMQAAEEKVERLSMTGFNNGETFCDAFKPAVDNITSTRGKLKGLQ